MTGKDLVYLAGTADLAQAEFSVPHLTLASHANTILTQYSGAYSSGCRWINETLPSFQADLDSRTFAHLADTFDADAEITITATPTSLTLRSKRNRHQLRTFAAHGLLAAPSMLEAFATVDVALLKKEVALADDLNDLNKAVRGPSGVNITTNTAQQWLRVSAFNGTSALLISQIAAEVTADISVAVPSKDLARGLGLLESGSAQLALNDNRLAISGEHAWFTCATEARPWPNFSEMLKFKDLQPVTFAASDLKGAATSARILNAADVLEVAGSDEGVTLRTAASEAGAYATAVDGSYSGSVWYAASDLLFAAKLGDEIVLEIGRPTRVRVGKRLLVVMNKIV